VSEFDYAVFIIRSGFGVGVAATIFPNLVISRPELAKSLNIYNADDAARRHCSDTGRRQETQHPHPLGRRHRLLERQRLQPGKE
jgi:hypothetical protein